MSPSSKASRPVVVIGAGRSGTKILRDTLCRLPGLGTWPCDEINYIWRHGNASYPSDELSPEHALPRVRRFIRRRFDRLASSRNLTHVVEKTCANSLRVEFVDRVLPDALFIFLVRDGRDVVASAQKRWRAPLDWPYLLSKARFVPISDLPYYGGRYLWNRFHRLVMSTDGRLASWGPRFEGMGELARSKDLPTVCAHQWRRCVERSEEAFASIDEARVFRVRYEDLVAAPNERLAELCVFLGVEASRDDLLGATAGIRAGRTGAWRDELPAQVVERILPHLAPVLERHGYEAGNG